MKQFLFSLAIACCITACSHHPAPAVNASSMDTASATDAPGMATDTAQNFFPVADFIGGQIKWIDSMKPPLIQYITINHSTRALPLSDERFKQLAAAFRQPDINDPALKKYYKESSYADQSIPSVVFSYTTTQPGQEIRKLDVIITPDLVKADKVKTIYLEKKRMEGDTSIWQKLYWRAGHNFMIVTEKQVGSTHLPLEQVKVVWDPVD